jgi:phytoene synthase
MPKNAEMKQAYQAARRETRFHAKSFYFSSFALPRVKRRHAYAVYALCRRIDDRIDEAEPGENLRTAVAELRVLLESIYAGACSEADCFEMPWIPAIQQTIRQCEIPRQYFDDLIRGVEMDRGPVRLENWEELDRYCYLVAGVVGLMMTRVFGLEDRKYEKEAVDLGCAMQLTNILRDVQEDLDRDRIYLPREEIESFGLDPQQLEQARHSSEWKAFMEFQIDRARSYYRSSEPGITQLPPDGARRTVWVMRDVYAGILEEIEKVEYDVFGGRCFVSFPRKCGLVLRRLVLQ